MWADPLVRIWRVFNPFSPCGLTCWSEFGGPAVGWAEFATRTV